MSMFIYGCCSSIGTSVVAVKELHIVVVGKVRLHGDPEEAAVGKGGGSHAGRPKVQRLHLGDAGYQSKSGI